MIATYYRLSLADEDLNGEKQESNSIQGQRRLVQAYLRERPDLANEKTREFVDDGYSGTSSSRPAFQEMIAAAQNGEIQTVIVKDFSRFARDYIEAGDYMERVFPLLGVRFISVNDGYDSHAQAGTRVSSLEVAIKNIINASYSRDLSAKIAAADHVLQRRGMYLGGYRPFGFLPDPEDCHKLIIDPVASEYVRMIFELALKGKKTGQIAKIMNEHKIPTPAMYHVAQQQINSEQKAWDIETSHWTSGNVYQILKNEKYKGTYVGAKITQPVPCKRQIRKTPTEQQVRIENCHAAIVTAEEFEKAQMVIQKGSAMENRKERQYPFKGKVYCGHCQRLMRYRDLKKTGETYLCRYSDAAVETKCERVPVPVGTIETITRQALSMQLILAGAVLKKLRDKSAEGLQRMAELERQEEELSRRKAAIVKEKITVYEDYADERLSREGFIRKRDALNAEENSLVEQIHKIREEKESGFQPVKKDVDKLERVMDMAGSTTDLQTLPLPIIEKLVDRVEIFNDDEMRVHFVFEDVIKANMAE